MPYVVYPAWVVSLFTGWVSLLQTTVVRCSSTVSHGILQSTCVLFLRRFQLEEKEARVLFSFAKNTRIKHVLLVKIRPRRIHHPSKIVTKSGIRTHTALVSKKEIEKAQRNITSSNIQINQDQSINQSINQCSTN